MAAATITGKDYPLYRVFDNDFAFRVPRYQRPYAWTTEETEELLDDLVTALGDSQADVADLNPYFLGSVVLIKDEGPEAEIIDGQQRLTTLTILLAVLRHLCPPDKAGYLTRYLYEAGDPFVGNPDRYRLTPRPRDEEFFQTHIQKIGGIGGLRDLGSTPLSDSQANMKANALRLLQRLTSFSQEQRDRLAAFVLTRCFLVIVSTPDFDSAYRIFSVLNDRGMDLTTTDILKSEVIGSLPDAQADAYAKRWEDAEEDLGRDTFDDLFAHIRTIYRKLKPQETILKEFRQHVLLPIGNPTKFVDAVLLPYADAFGVIRSAAYLADTPADADPRVVGINAMLRWLNRIDNFDWVPPALAYYVKHQTQPEELLRYFRGLERLAAGMMLRRAYVNERIGRYGRLLTAIEANEDLFTPASPLSLTPEERNQAAAALDGQIYRMPPLVRQYILLRLDADLAGTEARYMHSSITVEHVLPQNPSSGGQWVTWYPDPEQREQWVHRLANLVLLSGRKNSAAQNYDFDTKKTKYFATKNGVCPFALTTQVLQTDTWTPAVLQQRQQELIGRLKNVWGL